MPPHDWSPMAPSLYNAFGSRMPTWHAHATLAKKARCGGRMTLWELNRITPAAFATALGGIFEHSPWVAERASTARPFGSIAALHAAMLDVVDAAPKGLQFALIRAHPELAGKAA